jgi:hypothetical protein
MGPSPEKIYDLLETQQRLRDLVTLTRDVVEGAARERTAPFVDRDSVKAKAEELKLERDEAGTEFGNVLDVLERGPEDAWGRALASALCARVLADAPPDDAMTAELAAADLLWLACQTPFDGVRLIDHALGDRASELWIAVAERVRRIDADGVSNARAEALLGCAALSASSSKAARKQCASLAKELVDPALRRIVAANEEEAKQDSEAADARTEPLRGAERLSGELLPTPRGPVATAALALTGLLFVVHAVRLTARLALKYRRPTEVVFDAKGVRVRAKTVLLGRTLRDSDTLIARSGLVRATREIRYPRAAFYAGLLALAAGSYLGVRTLVDGVRSASPSLLLAGLVVVALGITLDFALTSLAPGAMGRCRLLFVPKTGPTLCVGDVDAKRADAALGHLAKP